MFRSQVILVLIVFVALLSCNNERARLHDVVERVDNGAVESDEDFVVSEPLKNIEIPKLQPYYERGYDRGHEDGMEDARQGCCHGAGYDDSNKYQGDAAESYRYGYEQGYDEGVPEGLLDCDLNDEEEFLFAE